MSKGRQYSKLIDPLLDKAHSKASEMIPEGASVIDIACGNGTLAMKHSNKAIHVTAIDLSDEMLDYARNRTGANNISNIEYITMDARDLSSFADKKFDCATISMAVHQFRLEEGISILKEMKSIAKEIIIVDYAFPLPGGFKGLFTRLIERIAGVEHNRNFKEYLKFGGLSAIMQKVDSSLTVEIKKAGSVFEIARVYHKT